MSARTLCMIELAEDESRILPLEQKIQHVTVPYPCPESVLDEAKRLRLKHLRARFGDIQENQITWIYCLDFSAANVLMGGYYDPCAGCQRFFLVPQKDTPH